MLENGKGTWSLSTSKVPAGDFNGGVPQSTWKFTQAPKEKPAKDKPGKAAPAEKAPPRRVVTITPAMAAQFAAARLVMHPTDVGLGPDPEKNEYKMIPVGFPIWLWAEGGDTGTKTDTESVAGISVSLTARLASVQWDLGDGTTLTCDKGTKFRVGAVEPATPSPTCGHVYEKMGTYTMTATTNWAIDWTAAGASGSIAFSMSRSRDINIGELQVLIR